MWTENQTFGTQTPSAAIPAGVMAQPGISTMHIEYVTNPYGRQAPHLLILQDGRVEAMTPSGQPVPGFAPDAMVVELLGAPGQSPTQAQLQNLQGIARNVTQMMQGQLQFSGHTQFLMNQPQTASAQVKPYFRGISTVDQIFEILGTPDDRRRPVAPGSLFNAVASSNDASNLTRFAINFPRTREITTLVVVPTHDPFKPEPTEATAYELATLKKMDMKNGLTDFRAHYLIARDGTLVTGRDTEENGAAVPGYSNNAIQVVVAGNGKAPTTEQRRMLMEFGELTRRHYDPQKIKAFVRDVTLAKEVLGVDGLGVMDAKLVRADAVNKDLAAKGQVRSL